MKRKTVVVLESGRLPELNMLGPITKPTRIALANIAMMVKNGKKVQECDPSNPMDLDKRITLTVDNVTKDNFPVGTTASKPNVEPKVEKKEEAKAPTQEPKKEEAPVEEHKAEATEEKKEDEVEKKEETKAPAQQNQNNQKNGKKNK